MAARTKTVVYTEPRDLEGTPFEVAKATAEQAAALLELAQHAVGDLNTMARLADMERQLQVDDECSADVYHEGPVAVALDEVYKSLGIMFRKVKAAGAASSYDPKHPPVAG